MITSDVTLFGIICAVIFFLFHLEKTKIKVLQVFSYWVPPLVACYLLMGGLNTFGLIDGNNSKLYFFSTQYLLPPAMIFMTMAVDMEALRRLGRPSLILFMVGTVSIIVGGLIALVVAVLMYPELLQIQGGKEIWRGLATITGSWIGGSASQLAAREVFHCDEALFSALLVADTLVQNVWLAFLLQSSRFSKRIDKFLRADNTLLVDLESRIRKFEMERTRPTSLEDFGYILFIGFGGMALAHLMGHGAVHLIDPLVEAYPALHLRAVGSQFFWMIVSSTLIGITLSFTRWKHLEGAGTTKLGVLFIYIVICTIGMQIKLGSISSYYFLLVPLLCWILFHGVMMFAAAYLMRVPFFFLAVASQANIGGPASAGAVAAGFSPILMPVAVLLATLSNVIGSYGAVLGGLLMEFVFSKLH